MTGPTDLLPIDITDSVAVVTGGASAWHYFHNEFFILLTKTRRAAAHKNLFTVLRLEYLYWFKVERVAT